MPSQQLKSLVDSVAPLFAGEAEVFRTYWTWSGRTNETDRLWLLRQARKEVWDTPLGDQRGLKASPLRPASGVSRPERVSINQIELTARSDMMSFVRRT